ncbi:HupE/UreJ family protein [Flavobacterium paronense]|uniref:HupE/UreJ family protein n=1 Tax=Flavobacterium paronense TaxID=1392775 RepID=A0ABV5GFA7_9FLAO|nr:HupE/UreJ family protein [Flavobacterium paronense]MDN3678631.1 HupE/UreJ family protein [Flavobacterium paronense]
MSDFWIYFSSGLQHLCNINAYTDVLFLLALTVPYEFKAWKRILILISLFTAAHTLAVLLSVFNIVTIKASIIAFIIPILILITALYNIISVGKSGKKDSLIFIAIVASLFGLFHGLGFSNYFNTIVPNKPTDKLLPLFESALGFGVSLLIVVLLALLLAYVVQTLLKFTKRDWLLIISAFVVGIVIPMIIRSEIWVK